MIKIAESLKEVIARLKAQKETPKHNPQPVSSPPVMMPKQISVPAPKPVEDEDEEEEEVGRTENIELNLEPQQQVKEELNQEQIVAMQIEMLQNDGRYRGEMLHQLQEINNSLVAIASILVDINGKK